MASFERELTRGTSIEELALAVAKDRVPSLVVQNELARIDAFAAPLKVNTSLSTASPREQHAALEGRIADELGFSGNEGDYHDPRNSYLQEVIARRKGLPITLAVIWMAIARRAGIPVSGVGFPGHFLVRIGDASNEESVLADPFRSGALVGPAELSRLSSHHLGGIEKLRANHLATTDTKTMLVRMLVNLKHAHEKHGDHAGALLVSQRLVELTGSVVFMRDRGIHAMALGAKAGALEDFDRYLEAGAPEGDAESIRRLRSQLKVSTKSVLQ